MRAPQLMVLLVATLGVAALVAYEAEGDVGVHRATAERALHDYLAVVGRGAVDATADVAAAEIASAVAPAASGRASSPYDLLPPPDVLVPGALACPTGGGATTLVRLDLRDGSLATSGAPVDAPARRWLRDTLTAAVAAGGIRTATGAVPVGLLLGRGAGAGRAVAYGVKRAPFDAPIAVYAVVTCPETFGAPLVARARRARSEPLAAALADSLLVLATSDAAATPRDTTHRQVAVAVLGGLAVRAWDGPGAARRLVVRPGRGSRLAALGVLAAITASLVLLALAQLGREQELVRLRADFTSSVSHELRTPLAQILLYGETLALGRARGDAERRAAAETIVREARRLMQMVENVLHVARAERRANGVRPGRVALAPLAEDVVAGFAPLARTRSARLEVTVPDDLVATAETSALQQVLLNLLDNAVRYGPPEQTIRVGGAASGARALLWVDDEGPGIPPRDRERIWAPFVRLARDRAATTELGTRTGSGLGLAVVRDLAELHGGATWVEDVPGAGRGARFVVALPIARAEGAGQTVEGACPDTHHGVILSEAKDRHSVRTLALPGADPSVAALPRDDTPARSGEGPSARCPVPSALQGADA